jgi:hypothetical protein
MQHRFGPEDRAKIIRCGAKTRRGTVCWQPGIAPSYKCRFHGGLSTGPKTPEGKARQMAACWKNGQGSRILRAQRSMNDPLFDRAILPFTLARATASGWNPSEWVRELCASGVIRRRSANRALRHLGEPTIKNYGKNGPAFQMPHMVPQGDPDLPQDESGSVPRPTDYPKSTA